MTEREPSFEEQVRKIAREGRARPQHEVEEIKRQIAEFREKEAVAEESGLNELMLKLANALKQEDTVDEVVLWRFKMADARANNPANVRRFTELLEIQYQQIKESRILDSAESLARSRTKFKKTDSFAEDYKVALTWTTEVSKPKRFRLGPFPIGKQETAKGVVNEIAAFIYHAPWGDKDNRRRYSYLSIAFFWPGYDNPVGGLSSKQWKNRNNLEEALLTRFAYPDSHRENLGEERPVIDLGPSSPTLKETVERIADRLDEIDR